MHMTAPLSQNLPSRPRRNRRSETFRSAMRESYLSPANFILPIFVHEESSQNQPISSMPDYYRLAYGKNVLENVAEARSYGINQVVIFPKVSMGIANAISQPHALVVLWVQVPMGTANGCGNMRSCCPQSGAAWLGGCFASAVAPVAGRPASFCL
jgi:hypothetical protein